MDDRSPADLLTELRSLDRRQPGSFPAVALAAEVGAGSARLRTVHRLHRRWPGSADPGRSRPAHLRSAPPMPGPFLCAAVEHLGVNATYLVQTVSFGKSMQGNRWLHAIGDGGSSEGTYRAAGREAVMR